MTINPGGTGLSGKSEQVFIRLADGAYEAAPFPSSVYIEKIESVQNMLLARATGHQADDNLYKSLRDELIRDEYIKPLLPRFVTTNRSLAEFWAYIKTKFSTYRERQEFIWGEFKPLLDGLEKGSLSYVNDADMQIRPLVPISDSETQSRLIQEKKDVVESQRQTDTKIRSILFLAADPTNESRLRLGEEFREIDEQLRLAKQRDQFKLELPQLSLRPRDITGALLNVEPEIVHFSGHGTARGALCFENQAGQTHLVEPDTLAALFEQFAHQVDCVLLNACYSETQAKAIAQHINYVIGMNEAIEDKAAIAFTLGFYQALGAGRTIEDAYKLGCVQIRLQGVSERLIPILITRQQAKPIEQQSPQAASRKVSLQAWNGRYVYAVDGGGGEVLADRNAIDEWATFDLIELKDNKIGLRAHNGDYVCAEGGGGREIIASRTKLSEWETFTLVKLGDDRVRLRVAFGQYVSVENDARGEVVARRGSPHEWATFRLIQHSKTEKE